MRLIDADTVITIQTYDDMFEVYRVETMTVAEAMNKWSDEGCPPTIDAEPVRHGEWIPVEMEMRFGTLKGVKCSLCGKEKVREGSNYCPNCGAKMNKGVQNDQN